MELRRIRNAVHAKHPYPGDYWNEMLVPVCVVLRVEDDVVTICDTTKAVGRDHWTWDLNHTKTLTVDEFNKMLSYGMGNNKYYASVMPFAHADFAKAFTR